MCERANVGVGLTCAAPEASGCGQIAGFSHFTSLYARCTVGISETGPGMSAQLTSHPLSFFPLAAGHRADYMTTR